MLQRFAGAIVILGVDVNWVLHRMWSVSPERCVDMIINSVCTDALHNKATHIFCAIDGDDVFRYELFPDYKANRIAKKEVESCYDCLPYLKAAFDDCGIQWRQDAKYEADDLLCSLATQYDAVTIVCKDKDHYQYLRNTISLYDPSHKVNSVPKPRRLTAKDIPALVGVQATQFVEYQALIGDASDNVSKLMSASKVKKGLAQHGTINAWAKADSEFRKFVVSNLDQIKLNVKLVKLVPDIKIELTPIHWGNYNSRAYQEWKHFCNPKSKGLF